MQGKYWMMTINNYTVQHEELMNKLLDNETFKVFQYEKGLETGTPHIQGYVELAKKRKLTSLVSIYKGTHLEVRKGTQQQAIDYCTKLDTREKEGNKLGEPMVNRSGLRVDLKNLRETIKTNTKTDFIQAYPMQYSRMHRSIDAMYESQYQNTVREPPKVMVIYGKAGTGKTRYVYDNHDQSQIYKMVRSNSKGGAWFNGYDPDQHKVLLIDDFYGWIQFSFMLQLLDRYPVKLETKGGMTNLLSTHIYITSNVHPNNWYNYTASKSKEALFRRIHDIIHLELNLNLIKTEDYVEKSSQDEVDIYLATHKLDFM